MENSYEKKYRDIVDQAPSIESRLAFVQMACEALGMLRDADLVGITDACAWEGLGWYIHEIRRDMRRLVHDES